MSFGQRVKLRIGQWFEAAETCRKCGISAHDADFAFVRVGLGKAECLPGFECARVSSEEPA